MVDRDQLSEFFKNLKEVSDTYNEKSAKLKKNIEAITDEEGNIPPKYQKALSKLEKEVECLGNQLSSGEEVLVKAVGPYVKVNAMGNLYFEKGNVETQYFENVYSELLDDKWSLISKAIDAFDLTKIDEIVQAMREKFISLTFSKYVSYAKTLSFNK